MRMRGLEPPRPERHTDLNRARLPIPPHPRAADSSRHTALRHAARQPPRRIGVISIVNRVLALLCAIGLCCLASACGSVAHQAAPESAGEVSSEVIVTLASPPVAGRTGASGRAARAAIDREQARFASALHDAIPGARIRWRYRLVLNGAAVVVPQSALGRLADPPGRSRGRRRRDVHHQQGHGRRRRQGRRDLVDRSDESGRRDQDRDHRRRRRPDPPVLRPCRLHDAGRLPEGAGCVHDGQGDRRACIRTGRHHVEVRTQTLRSRPVRACDPCSGDRCRQRRHRRHGRGQGLGHRAAGLHRQLQGAQRPDRRERRASMATRPSSSPRSRPRWRTAWT